jgi:hypothetical protein
MPLATLMTIVPLVSVTETPPDPMMDRSPNDIILPVVENESTSAIPLPIDWTLNDGTVELVFPLTCVAEGVAKDSAPVPLVTRT